MDVLDPFLMLDHMGPATYGPGEGIGAPDHPHRGFETVTYILEGEMQHEDSVGNKGLLKPGWCQWMTAGSGVVHSEMPSDKIMKEGGTVEGFQLWVNLPAKDKMIPPRYQDTPVEKIPKIKSEDGRTDIVVIAGESHGTKAYIETRSPMLYLDIKVGAGARHTEPVPKDFNAFFYVFRGTGKIAGEKVGIGSYGRLVDGEAMDAEADSDSGDSGLRFLLIGGLPLNEPVARYGPFVMNTEEQIYQAFVDFQTGQFGKIEGSEKRARQTEEARKMQQQTGRWERDEM
eukprot:Clim_evm17s224 gene=Clim_evmTU17s224